MTKKVLPFFVLITLAACLLSYKFGSAPVALAKARPSPQETADSATPLTLPAAPATWALTNNFENGTAWLSVTEPAVSGAQHVATCVTGGISNLNTTYKGTIVNLVNGSAGGSSILLSWPLVAPPSTEYSVNLCGLNVVGTVDTPMTLEVLEGSGLQVSINLVGYDAQ